MRAFPVPEAIKRFARRFKENGFSLYIVGGAVRDHLMGLPIQDFDFTTDAQPQEVMSMFKRVIPTGIEHGTVTVLIGGERFEVTTFRSEGEYHDGRHPDSVTFIRSLEEDLKRRDFTINAFAADCENGKILDYHQGQEDLKHGIIRAIGEPMERFEEDALRIVRAARFASKLDFSIEQETLSAMGVLKGNLRKVSYERIRDELFKLVMTDHPCVGLGYLRELGLLEIILPELEACRGVYQGGIHHEDVLDHSISACQASVVTSKTLEVRLAALLHDIGKARTVVEGELRNTFNRHDVVGAELAEQVMRNLKASNEQVNAVTHLVRHHMFDYQSNWTDSAVRRFITRIGVPFIPLLFQLRLADQIAIHGSIDTTALDEFSERIQAILCAQDALTIKDLAVNGNDLITLGFPKGELIGKTLNMLLETVLDDPKQNTRECLLMIAKNYQSLLGLTSCS